MNNVRKCIKITIMKVSGTCTCTCMIVNLMKIPKIIHLFTLSLLGKPQKKNPPLMARPLRGGGGEGGLKAIKEKITFFKTFFFISLPFKNKIYFTLDNLS